MIFANFKEYLIFYLINLLCANLNGKKNLVCMYDSRSDMQTRKVIFYFILNFSISFNDLSDEYFFTLHSS